MPFWAQALVLCALFAIAGVAVVDDYGVTGDEATQRQIARANAAYIITGDTERLRYRDYRYYGIAFETPLLLAERAFGLRDTRPIYLTRHLLTHLFFIAGGFACAMLAYRMLGSRWIATFAMLMFLLHPRLYAHSFVNTKDIPFAALLTIALYLAHRAFRKDTLGAFLLCGIAVGLAINLRPFALMLPPMLLAMRALDLWQANSAERKRILLTSAAFLAATLATAYITHPHYWENPLRLIESVRALSQHPTVLRNLFMGEFHRSDSAPWNYIPVWFAITAPPVALALGALGAAAICRRAIAHPIAALRDRETRFGILPLGCVVLPVAVVIALQSNIYDGWRQTHFLWAPFCLLAAVGLHRLASAGAGNGEWNIAARLPDWVRGVGCRLHTAQRALAYGVAGVGVLTTLTAMAALHPHQQVYFNAPADTRTPGSLANRYDMDYWILAQRQSLEYLLARYPDDTLRVFPTSPAALILPPKDRNRIAFTPPHKADFHLKQRVNRWNAAPPPPPLHDIRAYGSPIASIIDPADAAYRAYHSAAYRDVAANGTQLAWSDFDIYAYDDALYYLSENCAPPTSKTSDLWIFLHIFPENPDDLPPNKREGGFANNGFSYGLNAAFFDNKCIGGIPLPDYPIARIRTQQDATEGGVKAWRADIGLAILPAAQAAYESIAAGDYGPPAAQSDFDLYLSGNTLIYLKEPCVQGDADSRFSLHIIPAALADLPADRRERGYANMDFWFVDHGADIGGKCVALRELPDYAIERIRTGQHVVKIGIKEWRVEIGLAARAAAQAAYESIAAGDYGPPAAQSDFDLYLSGTTLIYLKEPCARGDADARFFLHIIPVDQSDLPAHMQEHGFHNSDFRFEEWGKASDDWCVALRELPNYAIERIATGQFVSGEGTVWRAEVELGE